MSYIQNVRDLVSEFLVNPKYIEINREYCRHVGELIAEEGSTLNWGMPSCLTIRGKPDLQKVFEYELMANAVNYCYWLGYHSIRPKGASSEKMYKLLTECWEIMDSLLISAAYSKEHQRKIIINMFIEKLSRERFPLLEDRVRHLKEIIGYHIAVPERNTKVEEMLDYLLVTFPGYAADPFLKRAFLLLIQMNRTMGMFQDEINEIPIPADYQVPKMLRWYQCIKYLGDLDKCVKNGELILAGSRMEYELRAATIRACDYIAQAAECSPAEVDSFLWGSRERCNHPFPLTITTNY